jgi:hypothetical protein
VAYGRVEQHAMKTGLQGLAFEPISVQTAEEAEGTPRRYAGFATKKLFLRDGKKSFYLFGTNEDATIGLKQLVRRIEAKGRLVLWSNAQPSRGRFRRRRCR